jgi:hypothetical protein
VRVTGFESDSRVPVKSQSRKRSKYRKHSTRNRVYSASVNQVYKSMDYSEDECKSLLRGTRMQNGVSNEGTNERLADSGGMRQGTTPPFPRFSCWGARRREPWLLAILLASVSMRLPRIVSHLASHAEHPKRTSAKRGATAGLETAHTADDRAPLSWTRTHCNCESLRSIQSC